MAVSADNKTVIGMVTNVLTPYWVHLFLRFAREVPGVRVATCALNAQGDQPWQVDEVKEIDPVCVGDTDTTATQATFRRILKDYRKGGRVIEWIKKNNVQVVVIGGYADATRSRVIRWCAKSGVKCLIFADSNIRSRQPLGLRGMVKRAFFDRLIRMVQGVLVCGRNGADYYSYYGFDSDRIFICPVEPDYDAIMKITPAELPAALRKHGLDPARKRLVVCSRQVPEKRVDMAIDAFAALADERPDYDLVIIGGGPLRETLRSQVPAAIKSRVFFTGFISDAKEIGAIYQASHVLVHPAEYEPFGLVICEAVAAGMAVVCSSIVGSAPEVVAEGVNGRYFPVGNLRLLIDALRDATDADRNAAYRAASPRMVEDWRRRGDPVQGLKTALRSMQIAV